jgi:hypothetical protein
VKTPMRNLTQLTDEKRLVVFDQTTGRVLEISSVVWNGDLLQCNVERSAEPIMMVTSPASPLTVVKRSK